MHRIVVIDDEQIVVDIVTKLLRRAGFAVESADNGTAGVRLVQETQPHLVICDMRMPGLSGSEVVALLQADARTRSIPILILSAYSSEENATIGDARLQKPFKTTELIETIHRLIVSREN